jgi:hypothetical protein
MLRSSSDNNGEEEKKSPVSLEVEGTQAIIRNALFGSSFVISLKRVSESDRTF